MMNWDLKAELAETFSPLLRCLEVLFQFGPSRSGQDGRSVSPGPSPMCSGDEAHERPSVSGGEH